MYKPKENADDIIKGYRFYPADNLEKLLKETAEMFYLIYANNGSDIYNRVSEKIWVYDEIIPDIIEVCKEDLSTDYYLGNLVSCMKAVYGVSRNEDVLLILKDLIQYELEEWGCVFVHSVADAIKLLEIQDDTLVLPEKWCSPKLYKQLGEFLKTFGCTRCKIKKRVAYKSEGDFTPEQIIKVGVQLNGVSLSEKFDFYPTPDELVEQVQELAEIEDSDWVLEPSAGTGSLLKGLTTPNIVCVELNEVLATILKDKYSVYNCAFEDYTTVLKFDKIIMNPPFGKRLDAKHIVRAFNDFLQDGGTLVAIHSQAIVNATDKASKAFQELYHKYGVFQRDYNNQEFKNSGKGTNIGVTISKLVKG